MNTVIRTLVVLVLVGFAAAAGVQAWSALEAPRDERWAYWAIDGFFATAFMAAALRLMWCWSQAPDQRPAVGSEKSEVVR